jgi:hypothetical protein
MSDRRPGESSIDYYTRLALERGGTVTGHDPPGPPVEPPSHADDPAHEKLFMADVVALAKKNGWKAYHAYDSRKSEAGFPDLVLVKRYVIYAELKTNVGRTTAAQEVWLEALLQAGAEVRVWRPVDWPEIIATLGGEA